MSSDEEEDLKMMRLRAKERQRSVFGIRADEGFATLESLKDKKRREEEMSNNFSQYLESSHKPPQQREPSPAKGNSYFQKEEDEDEATVVEEAENGSEEPYEGLRATFPLSFGRQQEAAPTLEQVHSQTKRGAGLKQKKNQKIQFVSSGNGKHEKGTEPDDFVGPPAPKADSDADHGQDSDNESDRSNDDDDDDGIEAEDEYRVPLSNEIVLKGHSRVVSALAVDPSGSRVLSGSYDYMIQMYDFQGMDAKLKPFRHLEPSEGHQVRDLSWSPSADMFLAVTGSAQAKILDRDGFTLGEFEKGDMYIRDLKHTKGHISGLTSGEWHPSERNTVLTASEDGSVRIWDTTNFKAHKQLIKPKLARPGRVSVTSCTWGPQGKSVAAGLADGSVQIWHVKSGWGSTPNLLVPCAHERGEDVTAVLFSADSNTMATRSTDATLKLWDLRKFKSPLKTFSDLPNAYPQTNVAWSPDERLLLTGTSSERGSSAGQVVFFDKDRLELVRRIGVTQNSVVRVCWHPKLNQILATSGDKKTGGTHVLYDPKYSEKGALSSVSRAPRRSRPEDYSMTVAAPAIHNPHALPMFREAPSRKRQREKARKDPIASRRPDLPMDGPGHGGRVGQSKGSLLTQYLLREGGLKKEIWMDEDPREAILKYAEVAITDPKYIAPAYAKTQPKAVFEMSDEEDEDK